MLYISQSQTITFSTFIAASSDDAEETEDGTEVDLTSSDLEMVYDDENQTVGIRFVDVNIPTDAIVSNAYIQFIADGDYSEATSLILKGEYEGNSLAFEDMPNNISSRITTSSVVSWDNIVPWFDLEAGEMQRTPDLSVVITEIITNNDWQEGNALTFIITGTGKRKAFAYDGNPTLAAELIIEYTPLTPIYNDLALTEIIQPPSTIIANPEVEIEVSITNIGLNPQTGFSVSYSLYGAPTITELISSTINTGESLNYTFSQTADMSVAGVYELEVEVILSGDENPTNNSILLPITTLASIDSLFFEQGASWKYLDDGSDQGTAWKEFDFNDDTWDIGVGHMGFGEGDETTLLESGHITYYFRKKVVIPDTSLLNSIYFNIVHDDGAVAYVNGTEVLRSSLMPSGPLNYLTGTTTFIPNDVENDFWTYQVDKSYFHNGENILAIEIHNQMVSSSDISFDCFVSDTSIFIYKLDGPYVFYRDGKVVVKTVEASGAQTYIYNSPEEANLICRFQNGIDSFAVQIQPELNIEQSLYSLPDKFFAISDIEGNLEAFVMVLKDAGIMDDDNNWIFDNGHLYFVGDIFDRGNNVTECLWLLYRLESQAEAQGGKIHFIMGNHEMMNLIFNFNYVPQKYFINVQLMGETLESIYANDSELGRWLRTKNLIEQAGPIIFVHGGLSPQVNALNLSYDEINYWGRYRMDSICQTYDCNIVNGGSDYGIYWYRGMADEEITQQQVDTIINNFEGEMVVIGHTVFDNITLLYDNKVICIDLDHKDNFIAGFMSALYYEDGNIYEFYTDGSTQTYTLLNTVTGLSENETQGNNLNVTLFPNPITSKATLRYTIPTEHCNKSSRVVINVFDAIGKQVVSLENKLQSPGTYDVVFDGSDLQTGVYHYRLTIDNYCDTGKIVLINKF